MSNNQTLDFNRVINLLREKIKELSYTEVLNNVQIEQLIELIAEKDDKILELQRELSRYNDSPIEVEN